MPSAENIQPDSRFLGLFIGRSGSGKSAAAYSFPHPIKVLDLDGRIRGGLVPWVERKGIDYDYFPPKDKTTVFQRLNDSFAALDVMLRTSVGVPYKTLVLDSITWEVIDLLLDAIPLTHAPSNQGERGRTLGTLQMAGPEDYKFQSTGTYQTIAYLKTLPIPNIIVTAHIVNKFAKDKNDKYGPNVIVGEQLSLTDKLAENVPSSFDNVFRFEKEDTGSAVKFFFEAQGELARNALNIHYGKFEITGKDFYKEMMRLAGVKGETTNA